jgi:hypothetical protein
MFVKPITRIPGWARDEVREMPQEDAVRLLMLGSVIAVPAPQPEVEAAVIDNTPRRRGRPPKKG